VPEGLLAVGWPARKMHLEAPWTLKFHCTRGTVNCFAGRGTKTNAWPRSVRHIEDRCTLLPCRLLLLRLP